MASRKIGLVLQRKFGRLATVLIYAVLEWVLILLLLIDALLSFLTTKFAQYFGLHPPCLWCCRLDHILGNEEPRFYRKLICDLHAKEISSMGYCHTHKNLSDVNGMCEDCLLSFATKNKSNSCTYKSLVGKLGGDLECLAAENEHENHLGFQMGNHRGKDEHDIHLGYRMGDRSDHSEHDIHLGYRMGDRSDHSEHDIRGSSQMDDGNPVEKSLEESANGHLMNPLCTCCRAPLKSRVRSPWFVQTKLIDGQRQDEVHAPSRNAVVDFAEDVDREEALKKSIGYPESILHECTIGAKEAFIEIEGEDLRLNPLDHIGYTELKATSDSESESSIPDLSNLSSAMVNDALREEGLCRQCSHRLNSPIEANSESVVKDLAPDWIPDAGNSCLQQGSETHGSEGLVEYPGRPVDGIKCGAAPKQYMAEGGLTMKPELGTGFEAEKAFPSMGSPETPLLSSDGQPALSVSHQVERDGGLRIAELASETSDLIHSSEEIVIAVDQSVSNELPLQGSSSEDGTILKYGLGELNWNNIPERGHPSSVSTTELKEVFPETAHFEGSSSPKDPETHHLYFGTEVLKPGLLKESKGTSAQVIPVEGVSSPKQVPEAIEEDFGTEDLKKGSGDIKVTDTVDQRRSTGKGVFGDEDEMNKRQEDSKLLLRCLSGRGLDQADAENSPRVPGAINTGDEYRTADMHGSIEGLHLLQKRLVIERNDSGVESLDGSILSEIEGESAVDRLKRQIELDRKALNTLYSELEEERSASAIAANQAMAMITRLQEEKAAMQMEALQYQRMMEEQAEYDQEALQLLNEIVVKREKEIKDLEKEVELYRKRFQYEAMEKRKGKRRKTSGEQIDSCLEQNDQILNDQYQKIKASSTSSLSGDTDETSSSVREVERDFDVQQTSQNTPAELTISAGGACEEQTVDDSLDESFVDFEEERLSILERLKGLEEKLHILADDGESECGEPQIEMPDMSMVHSKETMVPDGYCESRSASLGMDPSIQETTNGNEHLPGQNVSEIENHLKETHWDKDPRESMNTRKSDPLIGSRIPIPRKVTGVKAKRLLPLFEATSFDEESLYQTEESYPANQTYDWRSVSMVTRDNGRLAIEEEVCHLGERLQALEADREFLKHTIKSLRKGDDGMKLVQEIAQNLRELRRIEMRASNLNDSFAQQNSFFIPSSMGDGEMMMQPHY